MINWKLRLQNKVTLTSILSNLFLIGMTLYHGFVDGFTADDGYLVISLIVSVLTLLGIVNDPTTEGMEDSDCVKSQEMLLGKSDRKE